MSLLRVALAVLVAGAWPVFAVAQSAQEETGQLSVELNAVQDVGGACRLTFVVENQTSLAIEQAVFETVIFDGTGGVVSLSLYDFRDLPTGRPRVRQFDVPGMGCDNIGRALINGANACLVDGAQNGVCQDGLTLSSRISVELLG